MNATQTPALSQHAMWPNGEDQRIRDAYDQQIKQVVPAPRSAS